MNNKAVKMTIKTWSYSDDATDERIKVPAPSSAAEFDETTRFNLRWMAAVLDNFSWALITDSPLSPGVEQAREALIDAYMARGETGSVWTPWEMAGIDILFRLDEMDPDDGADGDSWAAATEAALR
jgi:hypothetical protein